MKTLKMAAVLGTAIFFMCCFATVSLGFNPQPEPPATSRMTPPGDDTMRTPGSDTVQPSPGSLTETNPDNIKIIPTMQGTVTDTKPVSLQGLQGSPKMMEPLDHPPEPGKPQMMQQTMPGPGSEKMDEEEEVPSVQQRSPKMIDPVDDGKPGMTGSPKMVHPPETNPMQPSMGQQSLPGRDKMQQEEEEEDQQGMPQGVKMMDQGDGGSPGGPKMTDPGNGSPGDPKMEDPGEGPTPGMKSQKKYNKQMRRY